uniref:Uncharacterized protein n=2 Tax=Arundo donax TaxID=35708 RepID=A0A0A9GU99_ARUDO
MHAHSKQHVLYREFIDVSQSMLSLSSVNLGPSKQHILIKT